MAGAKEFLVSMGVPWDHVIYTSDVISVTPQGYTIGKSYKPIDLFELYKNDVSGMKAKEFCHSLNIWHDFKHKGYWMTQWMEMYKAINI